MQKQSNIHNFLVLIVSTIVAWFAVPLLQYFLFDPLFMGRTFSSSSEWLDGFSLLLWLFHVLVFVAFGFILSKFINSTRRWLWVTSFGAFYSVFNFAFSRNLFFQELSIASYFWVYGLYVMPIIGALLGYFLHAAVSRRAFGT